MKLVILGGGPAGYAAASSAAHVGGEVTLVEELSLGGNCTMTDAVPSKTLLTTADAMLEVARPDGNRVLTTRQVFDLRELPDHLVVLGAGPTGCEFADFFSRCGSRVTLVSSRGQILPGDDPDLAEVLEEVFLRRGMDVVKGGRAAALEAELDQDVRLVLEDGRELAASHCLLCIGMRPSTAGLCLERAGVELGERGAL